MQKTFKYFFTICLVSILFSSCNTGLQQPLPPKSGNAYVDSLWAENHFQDKVTGDKWISRYRELVNDTTGSIKHKHYVSESFNALAIYQLLALKGSVGIRNHFGIDDNGNIRILITGVDETGKPKFLKITRDDTKRQNIKGGVTDKGEEVYIEVGSHP